MSKNSKQIALEIQNYFGTAGTPQQFEKDTKFIEEKLRGFGKEKFDEGFDFCTELVKKRSRARRLHKINSK